VVRAAGVAGAPHAGLALCACFLTGRPELSRSKIQLTYELPFGSIRPIQDPRCSGARQTVRSHLELWLETGSLQLLDRIPLERISFLVQMREDSTLHALPDIEWLVVPGVDVEINGVPEPVRNLGRDDGVSPIVSCAGIRASSGDKAHRWRSSRTSRLAISGKCAR